MDKYFVYILVCSDGKYYVGMTHDVDARLYEHNSGLHPEAFTFKRRPVKLIYQEGFPDYDQAFDFERQIKKWTRAKKEALIAGDWDKIEKLAKRKKRNE